MSNVPPEVWLIFFAIFLNGIGIGIAIKTYSDIRDEEKRLRNKR